MVTGVVGNAAVTLPGQPHRPYMHFSFRNTARVNAGVGGEMAFESRGRPPSHRRPPNTVGFDDGNFTTYLAIGPW